MDNQTLMLGGLVKLVHPKTSQEQIVEPQGFDIWGFLFAPLRFLFAGMFLDFIICLPLACFGWLPGALYCSLTFKKKRFQNLVKKGWVVKQEGSSQQKAA